jgi:ribosomal protein S18 acetylase RimI-like enzyme
MTPLSIRPFAATDRAAVREIACATGFMGEPADWFWRHRESFADIWTSYYTDIEPESCWVATEGGQVMGYLTGCVDTARAPSPARAVTRQMLRHALLFRPGTAGFFWRSIRDVIRSPAIPSGELDDPRWPAHLHVDLLPEARGRGAGAALMRAWWERLESLGSPGCHLGTLAENRAAIAFFERCGFQRHGDPVLAPGMRLRTGERMHLQLMVRGRAAD